MQSIVFKLALAVIIAAAIVSLISMTFSVVDNSSESTISNIEKAREAGMNNSISYLQK